MYRYIMIHINTYDQCHKLCVHQVRHQHICLHTGHWGKSPHYRSFCHQQLTKVPFSRQTSIKGQVSEPSRGLWGRRSQRRRRRRRSRGKGPSPTIRCEVCHQREKGAVRSLDNRTFCDQFKRQNPILETERGHWMAT